jgi:hypothetical protein
MLVNSLILLVLTIEVPQASTDRFYDAGLVVAQQAKEKAKQELKAEQEKIVALGRVFADPSQEKIEYIKDQKGKPAVKAPNRAAADKEKAYLRNRIKEIQANIEAMPNWSSGVKRPIIEAQVGDLAYFFLRYGDVRMQAPIGGSFQAGSVAAYRLQNEMQKQESMVAFQPQTLNHYIHVTGGDTITEKLCIITGKTAEAIQVRVLSDEETAAILKQCDEKAQKQH